MVKRILSVVFSMVLVFTLFSDALSLTDWSSVFAAEKEYTAYMQFMNADGSVGNAGLTAFTVSGAGTYTASWDMWPGYSANTLAWLYVEIDDAYADFEAEGYRISNVILMVDGVSIPVNQNYVWNYASAVEGQNNDYIIELYNAYGVSGAYGYPAFDITKFNCRENITVSFTIEDTDAKDSHLILYGQGTDINGNPVAAGIGNIPAYVPGTDYYYEGCKGTANGPGTYTMRWDVYPGYGYTITELELLYVEIDDAYTQYAVEEGYTVENVVVTFDGKDYPVNQDQVVLSYNMAEAGKEDNLIIVIYNPFFQSIDATDFGCSEYVEVKYTIADPTTKNCYLQFMGKGPDKDGNSTDVGNYPYSEYGLPGANFEFTGPGEYEITWNVDEYMQKYASYYYEEYYNNNVDVDGVTWFYLEFDNAYSEFVEKGYYVDHIEVELDGRYYAVNQNNVYTYASLVEGETDDYIVELYNDLGLTGAANYPSSIDIDDFAFDETVTVRFTIIDGADPINTDVDAHTGKWISTAGSDSKKFTLTLEGWVSGEVVDYKVPSDVVLVLDQSASMYIPVGLDIVPDYTFLYTSTASGLERYGTKSGDVSTKANTFDQSLDTPQDLTGILELLGDTTVDEDTNMTNAQKLANLGYFVAQSRNGAHVFCQNSKYNTHVSGSEACRTWDWFVVQYFPGTDGQVDVNPDGTLKAGCDDELHLYRCTNISTPHLDSDGVESKQIDNNLTVMRLTDLQSNQFYFYKSQYGALLDAMTTFVNELEETGVNHRVAVVGFSSESTSNTNYATGAGLYVDGNYHTFNAAIPAHSLTAQVGLHFEGNPGIVENVSGSKHKCTTSLCGNCTEDMDRASCACNCRICWIAWMTKEEERGVATTLYDSVRDQTLSAGDAQVSRYYDEAFELLSTADGYQTTINNLNAVMCDYFYTNHYIGMYMAKQILAANQDVLPGDEIDVDGDGQLENIRQKKVILFTDGTPVAQNMQHDDGFDYTYKEYINDLTIQYAREMEKEYDADVFTVGTSTINYNNIAGTEYLYYTASDFGDNPRTVYNEAIESVEQGNAKWAAVDGAGNVALMFDYRSLKYYTRIDSATSLVDSFRKAIVNLGGTSSSLTVTASLQDIIYEDFELSEELKALVVQAAAAGKTCDTNNYPQIFDYLKAYTVSAMDGRNGTVTTDDDFFNFPENTTGLDFEPTAQGVEELTKDDVRVEIGMRADGRYYLRVDGFDYEGNFVSANGRDTDGDNEKDFWGKKLVVIIPIEMRDESLGGAKVQSNYDTNQLGSSSGIITYEYIGDRVSNIKEVADFRLPYVDLPTSVTVKKVVVDDDYAGSFGFAGTYEKFGTYSSTNIGTTGTQGTVLGGNYLQASSTTISVSPELEDTQSQTYTGVKAGTTFTIQEEDFANYDVTVKVYDKDGNDVTNSAIVTVDAANGKVIIEDLRPNMTVEFTNTRKRASLTIDKNNWNSLDPSQTFIFKVQGVSGTATENFETMNVVVTEGGMVTLQDLIVGEYIITEANGWSWRYSVGSVKCSTGTAASSNGGYKVTLVPDGLEVDFNNTRTNDKWIDGNDVTQNLFKQ